MNRLLELLLGLDRGFLGREGDLSIDFDPRWPWGEAVGHATWNMVLLALAAWLVAFVYRREGRSRRSRIVLGSIRFSLLALLIVLLNRPQITLTQSRVERSVLALMIDNSLSMRLADQGESASPVQRLEAVQRLLNENDAKTLEELAKIHDVRLFRFADSAQPIDVKGVDRNDPRAIAQATTSITAEGGTTRLVDSVRAVAGQLAGQRLAGIVAFTDGRDTSQSVSQTRSSLRELGVKLFPVAVGSDQAMRNVELQQVDALDSVFAGDVVNIRATVRSTGVQGTEPFVVRLTDAAKVPILDSGKPVEVSVVPLNDTAQTVELQFVANAVGMHDVRIEAVAQPGEIELEDNLRIVQLTVLDSNIKVLYVDGYPRWDYRYLTQTLVRDPTVEVSCLLTSADQNFAQEGDRPITRFPETMDELAEYDVVLLGDVDPRQFTDSQLQLINEFVARRGGGFGMTAGPRFSPRAYRNSPIEPLLPVDISRVVSDRDDSLIAEGFRPQLTQEGREGSLFRFLRDAKANEQFMAGQLQPIFWFAQGATNKVGVGRVLAQHPTATGPDGRPVPIMVIGRFGTGRTLYSGIDDSWRWRFYTGENVFNTYWIQSLRYLARGKRAGERKLSLSVERPDYQLGETARVSLRLLDSSLANQLPDQLQVQVQASNQTVAKSVVLTRRPGEGDVYTGAFAADAIGRFVVRLPVIASGVPELSVPVQVDVPRVELADPSVDRATLTRLATETGGVVIELADASSKLLSAIPSAQRDVPLITSKSLWDAPAILVMFILLITAEWVARKFDGLV